MDVRSGGAAGCVAVGVEAVFAPGGEAAFAGVAAEALFAAAGCASPPLAQPVTATPTTTAQVTRRTARAPLRRMRDLLMGLGRVIRGSCGAPDRSTQRPAIRPRGEAWYGSCSPHLAPGRRAQSANTRPRAEDARKSRAGSRLANAEVETDHEVDDS